MVTVPVRLAVAVPRRIGVSGVLLATILLVGVEASANELVVDARSIRMNDLLTITVTLEGSFAEVDGVDLPLRNLALSGEPWVSSEFRWVNGRVSRQKTFRYRARPLAIGAARVGPLVLTGRDGQKQTLAAVEIQVLQDRVSQSNDPETVARELEAARRPLVFVVAEADRREAFAGEQIVISWSVYNAATVQQWQVVETARMPDFWVEEIDSRVGQPQTVYVGDRMMQRMVVRRIAVYPLRSGVLSIGGTTIEAAVLQGSRGGPFSIFQGSLVEVSFTSAPLSISVKPLPAGPPVDAVGDLALRCELPVQQSGGPVVLNVALAGAGNLRAAQAPRFEDEVEGLVEIEGGEVSITRGASHVSMTRRWRYLLFPSSSGTLHVSPLSMRIFDPATGQRRVLRCSGASISAVAAAPLVDPPAAGGASASLSGRVRWQWLAGVLLIGLAIFLAVPRIVRYTALRREVREVVHDASPAEIRARLESRLDVDGPTLLAEKSDRGDAWRALRSLLDAVEHERDIALDAGREIERRVRDVLRYAG